MNSNVTGLGIGRTDEWYTPRKIFNAMGVAFDMDVASPPEGPLHVPAREWIYEDSLVKEWIGFVWMNPPFGGRNALMPWLDKFFLHGNGVALTPDRTSAPWFHFALERADLVLFTRGRTPFLNSKGEKVGSPAFGTTLWASGRMGVEALERARDNGLGLLLEQKK